MARIVDTRSVALRVARRLRRDYPDADCALRFGSPLQLMIATILSAQCTDERVNQVVGPLFQRCTTAQDFACIPQEDLEGLIHSTGFFRNKAQNIRKSCKILVEQYGGELPRDLDALVRLPGVGRKTANVILGTAFGLPTGIVVDTHVKRIARRLGLTRHEDPVKIEADLMKLLPRGQWIQFSHRLIHHGRRICRARQPLCHQCGLQKLCPQIGVRHTH